MSATRNRPLMRLPDFISSTEQRILLMGLSMPQQRTTTCWPHREVPGSPTLLQGCPYLRCCYLQCRWPLHLLSLASTNTVCWLKVVLADGAMLYPPQRRSSQPRSQGPAAGRPCLRRAHKWRGRGRSPQVPAPPWHTCKHHMLGSERAQKAWHHIFSAGPEAWPGIEKTGVSLQHQSKL